MAYTKTTWVNNTTDLSAANMNNLETQYDKALADVVGFPSGGIIMWSGTIANIPTGWLICDGSNGTPNLLGRFIEGVATAATNPGTTGGATAKTTAGHIHSQPTHTHSPGGAYAPEGQAYNVPGWAIDGSGVANAPTADGGGDNTGSQTDGISDIRPKFYDLAYIMKS
jgi:hypothetical protein